MLNDRNVDLIDEAIDVAVRIGSLADSGLTARSVGEVRRLWVASPGYLESRGVLRSRRGAVRIAARLRTDDIETRLGAVREGRGIGQFLSYQVADDLAAGRLVRLLRAYEQQAIPVHLLTKGRTNRAPKVDAFLDFAARRLLALPVLERERGK